METSHENMTTGTGWIFIVLLLFFGIFGCGNGGGIFGRREDHSGELADLIALKSVQHGNGCQIDRDILDLKCNVTSQFAVQQQQADTAFRTLLCNQDAGFANLRNQMLQDQLHERDLALLDKGNEVRALQTQMHNDNRFNAIEAHLAEISCNCIKRPPFYPMGCSPCVANCCATPA